MDDSRNATTSSSSTDNVITKEWLSDVTMAFILEHSDFNTDASSDLTASDSWPSEDVFNMNSTDGLIMDILHENAITDVLHKEGPILTTTTMELITDGSATDSYGFAVNDIGVGGLLEGSPWQGGLYVSALFLLIVSGTIGNILLIGAYFSKKGLCVVGAEFILNLAVADLMIAAVALPMCLVGAVQGGDYFDARPVLCELIGLLCLMGCVGALLSILAISVNRLVFVCFNDMHAAIYKPVYVWMMVVGIWGIAFVIDLPHFVALQNGHHYDAEGMQCSWNRSASTSYTIFLIGIILASIASMIIIYVIIFQKVRKVTGQLGVDDERSDRSSSYLSGGNKQGTLATNVSGSQGTQATNTAGSSTQQEAGMYSGMYNKGVCPHGDNNRPLQGGGQKPAKVKGWKMCKTLMVIVFAYVICWLPYCLVVLIDMIHDLPVSAHLWATLLAHAHSSVSFVIYACTSGRYSQAYAEVCCVRAFMTWLMAEYSQAPEEEEEEKEKEKPLQGPA